MFSCVTFISNVRNTVYHCFQPFHLMLGNKQGEYSLQDSQKIFGQSFFRSLVYLPLCMKMARDAVAANHPI